MDHPGDGCDLAGLVALLEFLQNTLSALGHTVATKAGWSHVLRAHLRTRVLLPCMAVVRSMISCAATTRTAISAEHRACRASAAAATASAARAALVSAALAALCVDDAA